jgi:hypothetical protein
VENGSFLLQEKGATWTIACLLLIYALGGPKTFHTPSKMPTPLSFFSPLLARGAFQKLRINRVEVLSMNENP